MALRETHSHGISLSDIGYINAQFWELRPSKETSQRRSRSRPFGDHARKLAVASTKSIDGTHARAAGGVEAAFSILSILDGAVPPTINLGADPECDLDYVPNTARQAKNSVALSNSFGFGTNATLIFAKPPKNSPHAVGSCATILLWNRVH